MASEEVADLDGDLLESVSHADFRLIVDVVLGFTVCVIGMITNWLSVMVFWELRLKETTRFFLFALSLSDLGSLTCGVAIALSHIPRLKKRYPIGVFIAEVTPVVAGALKATLTRISTWITALVSFERSLRVLAPIRAKKLFTKRRSMRTVYIISCIMFVINTPVYVLFEIEQRHEANTTRVSSLYSQFTTSVAEIASIVNVIIKFISIVVIVLAFLCLLYSILQQRAFIKQLLVGTINLSELSRKVFGLIPRNIRFRLPRIVPLDLRKNSTQETVSETSGSYSDIPVDDSLYFQQQAIKPEKQENGQKHVNNPASASVTIPFQVEKLAMSSELSDENSQSAITSTITGKIKKEQRMAKIVALLALITTLSLITPFLLAVISLFVPEFNHSGTYNTTYTICDSIARLVENISASINIVLYCCMNPRFREALRSIVCREMPRNKALNSDHSSEA